MIDEYIGILLIIIATTLILISINDVVNSTKEMTLHKSIDEALSQNYMNKSVVIWLCAFEYYNTTSIDVGDTYITLSDVADYANISVKGSNIEYGKIVDGEVIECNMFEKHIRLTVGR